MDILLANMKQKYDVLSVRTTFSNRNQTIMSFSSDDDDDDRVNV